MISKQSPFIIWTFRRSGGTNIGQALFESSGYDSVEHEPFNIDRVFNHVIKNWYEKEDKEKLYKDIEKIISKKVLIKHCLEIMPAEINLALAEVSAKYGYKHVFLYRENPVSRLLSLNYSMKTNVWGKEHIKTRQFSQDVFNTDIPIKQLVSHELESRDKMNFIHSFLVNRNIKPLAVSFEQLYKSDFTYSSTLVKDLFVELIGSDNFVTKDKLNKWLKKGGQGTNEDYLKFPNSQEFMFVISSLPEYRLYEKRTKSIQLNKSEKVIHADIWESWPSVYFGKYHFHGVILSKGNVNLRSIDESIEIIKGLRSDNMAKKYPEVNGSDSCRFITTAIQYSNEFCLS